MYGQREFSELFRKEMAKAFSGVDGVPTLTSKDLNRPEKTKIVISAGARWTKLSLNRPVWVWTPDHRQIDYIPGHHPGDLSADTAKPWNTSITGAAKLYAAGEWHIKTPLIGGDVEGTYKTLIKSDVPPGFDGNSLAGEDLAGTSAMSLNLTQIAGTNQTGADLGALIARLLTGLAPIVWGAVTLKSVVAADIAVVAANPARRGLVLYNADPAKIIAVGTRNPMTALTDGNIAVLQPGDVYRTGPLDFETLAALRAFGQAGGVANNLACFEGA